MSSAWHTIDQRRVRDDWNDWKEPPWSQSDWYWKADSWSQEKSWSYDKKMRHGLQDHNAQSAVATGVRVGASLEAEAILRGQETQSAVATGVRVEARVEAKTIPVRTQRTV